MKKDRGHIKDFYLYMLGLRKFNPKKPYDQQGKMRKRPGVKIPTFEELFPAPDYSALREDAFTLRKEQYLARLLQFFLYLLLERSFYMPNNCRERLAAGYHDQNTSNLYNRTTYIVQHN